MTPQLLEAHLAGCVGLPIFSVILAPFGDYSLRLEIGERRRRSLRLANPRLSFLQRTYEGSHSFLIECPWRLEGPQGVLTSYLSRITRGRAPEAPGGGSGGPGAGDGEAPVPERAGTEADTRGMLEDLQGESVLSAVVVGPAYDLRIGFAEGVHLTCFCAEVDPGGRNNWAYWAPEAAITIGPKGVVGTPPETPNA